MVVPLATFTILYFTHALHGPFVYIILLAPLAVLVTFFGQRYAARRDAQAARSRVWERRAAWLRSSAVAALRGVPEASRYAEEWEYDMAQLPEGRAQFRWALSLRLRAPRAIRKSAAAKTRTSGPPMPPIAG